MPEEINEIIDPKKSLIEVKSEQVLEVFSIEDLENQILNIENQISRIESAAEAEISSLEKEKIIYRDKILANAYDGYELPDVKFVVEDTPIEATVEEENIIEQEAI